MIMQHIYVNFSQRDEPECILISIYCWPSDRPRTIRNDKKIEFSIYYLELNVYVFQFQLVCY